MLPKRAGEPLGCEPTEKTPKLMNMESENESVNIEKKNVSEMIQELVIALEQNDDDQVLHVAREIVKTSILPADLTVRLLKFCIQVNDESITRQLLDNQVIDLKTPEGGELLKTAVNNDRIKIATMLVRSGADLSVRQSDNSTLLHTVVRRYLLDKGEERELFRLMLDCGADVNACDTNGSGVLQDAIRFDCPCKVVEELVVRGAQVKISFDNKDDDLFWALENRPELLLMLIKVPDEGIRNRIGTAAIYHLIRDIHTKQCNGDRHHDGIDTIKEILDLGVPLEGINPFHPEHDGDGSFSLLDKALFFKIKDAVELFLKYGADVHSNCGETPLYQATTFKGYTHISRMMIERGASIHARNRNGGSPIHGACSNESLRNIHLFLNLGADLNVTDKRGRTPFFYTRKTAKLSEAHCLVIKHLALIIAKGGSISDADMQKIYQYEWSVNHFDKCTRQLEQMKVEKIYNGVSYFSLLLDNSYDRLQWMKNRKFVESFKQNEKTRALLFPEYSYMLLHSFQIAEIRCEILLAEKEKMKKVFSVTMPDHIVENISYHLCLEKFEQCRYEYYMSFHANLKYTKADKAKIL